MKELLKAMNNNFKGFEELHETLLNDIPKYGNDDDYADDIYATSI